MKTGSRIPRPSQRGNAPISTKKQIMTVLGSPRLEIFKGRPTMQDLDGRSLPTELAGRPRIFGNGEQTERLYAYVRSIAQQVFVPTFFKSLFPNSLSAMKNVTVSGYANHKSKIPAMRRRSIAPEIVSEIDGASDRLNLSGSFDQLKRLLRTQRVQMLAISDFLILYSAVVLLVCDKDENQLSSLYFMKQLLQASIPHRPGELGILFAVLIRQGDAEARVRGHAVEVLAMVCDTDQSLRDRVKAGSEHRDPSLSGICRDSLRAATCETSNTLQRPTFADVPSESSAAVAAEMFGAYMEAIDGGQSPENPIVFARSVVDTMRRLSHSSTVLVKGAECVRAVLASVQPLSIDIVSYVLSFCFEILAGDSFLDGDDSFDAVEAVQNLSDVLFEGTVPSTLMPSISGAIATARESHIPLIVSKVREYITSAGGRVSADQIDEIAMSLDAFHPAVRAGFLAPTSGAWDTLVVSIRRLMDASTIFEETDAIIARGDPAVIARYPVFLQGFLQRAFVLLAGAEPQGMSDRELTRARHMMRVYNTMSVDDIAPGGQFSAESLSSRLEQIRGRS